MTALAAGIGGAAGGPQGLATALSVDANNRQLHPDELQRIRTLAKGDPQQEARLTAAACALVQCYAEYPEGSVAYTELKRLAEWGASDGLAAERLALAQYQGMFTYTNIDGYKDTILRVNTQYNLLSKAGGTATVVGGLATGGAAAVLLRAGMGAVEVGVALGGAALGADQTTTGITQLLYGTPQTTMLHQALRGLGLSAEAANYTELAIGLGTAGAGMVRAVTRVEGVGGNIAAINFSEVIAEYSPLNPGPLIADFANTFRSGTYSKIVTQQPTTLYRVYGGSASEIGGYWTTIPPTGPVQSIIDYALNPQWGNTATNVVRIEVPSGTTFYQGFAAPQGGLVGGGIQVLFPPGFKVNSNWIKKP
jgi:filamentous hemagglutinin